MSVIAVLTGPVFLFKYLLLPPKRFLSKWMGLMRSWGVGQVTEYQSKYVMYVNANISAFLCTLILWLNYKY